MASFDERDIKVLDELNSTMSEISKNVEFIRDYYERNPMPYVIDKTQHAPMKAWRYVFNWIMIVWLTGVVAVILS